MSLAGALSEPLRSSRTVKVIERSLERERLPHGILLCGENLDALEEVAIRIAENLLAASDRDFTPSTIVKHPDVFVLRPESKARQIRVHQIHELIREIGLSPHTSDRKVALIYEADRMNVRSQNILLKTLEEPPLDTTLLLLTAQPYDLLDTIRSRCFRFPLVADAAPIDDVGWANLLDRYSTWLSSLSDGPRDAQDRARLVFEAYGMTAIFKSTLRILSEAAWSQAQNDLPPGLSVVPGAESTKAERDSIQKKLEALESSIRRAIRQRMFTDIETSTRQFAIDNLSDSPRKGASKLVEAISEIEHCAGLLEVNLREDAALEHFLLRSLKIWTA